MKDSNSPDVEVIVVGGGPAGAATASHLAARGRDVLLLERGHFPRQKPCGEYYSPGVVDALQRLGALERVLASEHERPGGMWIRARGSSFELTYPSGPAGLSAGQTGGRRGLGIRRYHFDAALVENAREGGVRVEQGVAVSGVHCDENGRVSGVRVGRGGNGSEVASGVVTARFVVGADGRHSVVARSLDLGLPVRWPRRLGLHAHFEPAADADLGPLASGLGEMHVGDGAYCGLAPVGGGLLVAGLVTPLGDKERGESTGDYFALKLDDVPGAAQRLAGAHRVGKVMGIGPLARRVARTAGPGYLLVGDAAGYFDPFTGEGVFRALRGAELASSAIEASLQSGDDIPEGYEQARRNAFAGKERLTTLVQLALAWPPALGYALKRLETRRGKTEEIKAARGDYTPATNALRPAYLAALLAP
ncbi:MAG: NAD(P)/FAD-dependent oxidoreductase [Rubrobacteraceae bacterium]